MKKFILSGMLALGIAAMAGQEAKAWVNAKFGVGLNWHWQSGGNNVLWGAFRGQQPGFDGGYGGYPYGGYGHGHDQPFFFGAAPAPVGAPALATPTAPPTTPPVTTPTTAPTQPTYWYGGYNPYHLTSYGSPYSSYYYPSYNGYYYAPNYWYGR